MRRPALFTLLLVATSALGGAWACSDSGPNAPRVRDPASFGIQPALDTVPIGDTVVFVAERADSTVDQWTLSDTSIAHLVAQERGRATIVTQAEGTVTIRATSQGWSGQATLVIVPPPGPPPPPPPPGPFRILPALDTASIYDSVKFVVEGDSPVGRWVLSDSTISDLLEQRGGWAVVGARAPGTVIVTARRLGDSAQATLVIREPDTPGWEAIDLGVLDADGGYARAINDDGAVIGRLDGPGYNTVRGFIYRDGAMHTLPSSGGVAEPQAISPSGKIAGIAYGATRHVVVWDTPDAAPRRLGEGREVAWVNGINERGDVLVTIHDTLGAYYYLFYRGVLWRNNVRVDLGDLSDSTVAHPWTFPHAWNTRNQIVGRSQVKEVPHTDNRDPTRVFHPYLWEDGVMRDLGVLTPLPCTNVATPTDCSWGEAVDINASGVVVGTVNDAAGRSRAFIWENGVMRDLGVAPGRSSEARAINDRGQVMGTIDGYTAFLWENGQTQITPPNVSLVPIALGPNGEVVVWRGGRDIHAFIWEAGQLIDLGPGEARAINGRGEVVGWRGVSGSPIRPMLWRKKP